MTLGRVQEEMKKYADRKREEAKVVLGKAQADMKKYTDRKRSDIK